jgi:aspartate kinase
MGEKISARIFASILSNKKLKTIVIDTESEHWPIITDDDYLNANPILEETRKLIKNKLEPLINKGFIPIICGFIGKNKKGEITTLGRGGSDTTAILIGNFINAKEILFIKDVGAIYSMDPKKVSNAKIVKNLSINEAQILTSGGAKIIQAKALKYVKNGMIIKIMDLNGSELSKISSKENIDLRIELFDKPILMITIISGKKFKEYKMEKFLNEVKKIGEIVLTSYDINSIIIYLAYKKSISKILERMHNLIIKKGFGKAMSTFEDLIMITIRGSAIETVPGIIDRIIHPLAEKKINIYGLVTISSSIRLFISKKDYENVYNSIKNILEVIKNEKS